jgi:hypothetical protein
LFTLFFSILLDLHEGPAADRAHPVGKNLRQATGISALTLIGASVRGPLQALLDTTA